MLLKYNPLIINRKIRSIEMQIEESYHLNVSHMTCDEVRGIIAVSFPIDKLVIWISEKKADLKRFKNDSSVRLSLLKQVLNTYTKEEQKQVVKYTQANSSIKAYELIERLQVDLYNVYLNKPITKTSKPQQAMVV